MLDLTTEDMNSTVARVAVIAAPMSAKGHSRTSHMLIRRVCFRPESGPRDESVESSVQKRTSVSLASKAPKEKSEREPPATIVVVVRSMMFCICGMLRLICRMRLLRGLGTLVFQ